MGLNQTGLEHTWGSDLAFRVSTVRSTYEYSSGYTGSAFITTQGMTWSGSPQNSVAIGGTGLNMNEDNTVFTPNIKLKAGAVIKSQNGGGQIELDSATNGVLVSTDSGGMTGSYLYLETGLGFELQSFGATDSGRLISRELKIQADAIGIGLTACTVGASSSEIFIQSNTGATVSTDSTNRVPVFVSTKNSVASPSITNSVLLGGINNSVGASRSCTLGGQYNSVDPSANDSVVIGGNDSSVNGYNTAILVGDTCTIDSVS